MNWNRTVLAAAIGAGLSAAYNVVRQSTPTVQEAPTVETPKEEATVVAPTEVVAPVVTGEPTLNQPTS